MGSEPVLCSRDGKIFVLRMESQDLITDGTPRWVTARRRGVDDAHGSSWTVTACDCPGGRGTGRVLPLVLGCPEGQRSLTVQRPVAPASGSVGPLLCPTPQESLRDKGRVLYARELELKERSSMHMFSHYF